VAATPMPDTRSDEETIYHALVLGLRDYVRKNGFPGVVLGLSGGIDSGLSAAIAADALGAEQVLTIRLPSPYSSVDTMEDAEQLAALLGLRMETVPITPAMKAASEALGPLFEGTKTGTAEENIQARLRGMLLMAVSNKFGPMVLTTGNKSEMSVGYATLYGDMCGGFSVLKDVYKTTVTKLSRWRNTLRVPSDLGFLGVGGVVIPERMIVKPPTAELRENQKDEDSLPPYVVLDTILRGLVERQLSVAELVAEGMDQAMVEKVARLVWAAEYKRRQSAPGVKITPMAFGRDRRWPITNRWRFA
jgi:NAD+ synthase